MLIRPVRTSDKPLLLDGFHRLSPESRYRRFFSPVHELGASQLRYLTEVDHDAHEALIALDPETGAGIGVARFVRSPADPAIAEVAIAVVDEWPVEVLDREQGIVELLMDLPAAGGGEALGHAFRSAARRALTVAPKHPAARKRLTAEAGTC